LSIQLSPGEGASIVAGSIRRAIALPGSWHYCSEAVMSHGSGISVVLPNFNHSKFVAAALRALLAQSAAPAEIIVIDDASNDDSVAVIRAIAASHPCIRLLVNPRNLGAIQTEKRALELASGRYLYLAAADDWVMPGFFALALRMLETYPQVGLFCGDAVLIEGESGRRRGYRPAVRPFYRARAAGPDEARCLLRRFDNWILTGSTIFRRDALEAAGGLDESCGSFADGYLLRKIAVTRGFCYAPRLVAGWRIFSGSVSRQTALDVEKAKEILQTIPVKISEDPAFPSWYARLFRNRWQFAAARLAAQTTPINHAVLDSIAVDSPLDAQALNLIRRALAWSASLERIATLAWLTIRLRPYPLSGLVGSTLSRWCGAR
jgi:glycosyltransferase involved in cell wall biosynthesis